jgi:hypothetical protein
MERQSPHRAPSIAGRVAADQPPWPRERPNQCANHTSSRIHTALRGPLTRVHKPVSTYALIVVAVGHHRPRRPHSDANVPTVTGAPIWSCAECDALPSGATQPQSRGRDHQAQLGGPVEPDTPALWPGASTIVDDRDAASSTSEASDLGQRPAVEVTTGTRPMMINPLARTSHPLESHVKDELCITITRHRVL